MIDFKAMTQQQQNGVTAIESLQEDEKDILKHFCSLAAEALLKLGTQRKASFDQVVINAFKNGIALGLGLRIEGGEVLRR